LKNNYSESGEKEKKNENKKIGLAGGATNK